MEVAGKGEQSTYLFNTVHYSVFTNPFCPDGCFHNDPTGSFGPRHTGRDDRPEADKTADDWLPQVTALHP